MRHAGDLLEHVQPAGGCGHRPSGSETSKVSQTAAALLVDPLDTAALADALRLVLTDDGLRAELRRRGLARAAHFTWQQTAAATLAIYRQEAHRLE